MKNFWETIGMLLAGLALIAMGVWNLACGEGWKDLASGVFFVFLGAALVFGVVYIIIREAKDGTLIAPPKYFKHEQAMEGEETAAELPFPLLHAQFSKLAEKDGLTCVEDAFLSRHDASSCGIRIYAMDGDAWVAPCDLNKYTTLQGKDITALCRQHKVKLADRTAVFNALAFYREGKLTVYPKKAAKAFHEAMMDPQYGCGILTTGARFDKWLHDYTAEG